jgi:hypothetical protein
MMRSATLSWIPHMMRSPTWQAHLLHFTYERTLAALTKSPVPTSNGATSGDTSGDANGADAGSWGSAGDAGDAVRSQCDQCQCRQWKGRPLHKVCCEGVEA